MNIDKMIKMLLLKLSLEYDITLIEFKTFKEGKIYNNFRIKIGNISEEFSSKRNLLIWLKDWK